MRHALISMQFPAEILCNEIEEETSLFSMPMKGDVVGLAGATHTLKM